MHHTKILIEEIHLLYWFIRQQQNTTLVPHKDNIQQVKVWTPRNKRPYNTCFFIEFSKLSDKWMHRPPAVSSKCVKPFTTPVTIYYLSFIVEALWSPYVHPFTFPLQLQFCIKKFPFIPLVFCLQQSFPCTHKSVTKWSSYSEFEENHVLHKTATQKERN